MPPFDFKPFDAKIVESRSWLSREYQGLRTGRASPALVESVMVSAYGSMMPLKQVANVGVEDARTLRISPWDASLVKEVERGIAMANLGVGTTTDSSGVRVSFPELTGERRQELVKMAKKLLEESRASLRVARDEAWKDIQEKERAGELTEDDKFSLKDELQKKVDAGNDALEKLFEAKEKEMTT